MYLVFGNPCRVNFRGWGLTKASVAGIFGGSSTCWQQRGKCEKQPFSPKGAGALAPTTPWGWSQKGVNRMQRHVHKLLLLLSKKKKTLGRRTFYSNFVKALCSFAFLFVKLQFLLIALEFLGGSWSSPVHWGVHFSLRISTAVWPIFRSQLQRKSCCC